MVVTEMPRSASSLPSRRNSRGGTGADVGQSVGKQDDAVDAFAGKIFLELPGAHFHAGIKRRAAVGLDAFDFFLQRLLVLDFLRRHEHPGFVAENDQRKNVVGREAVHQLHGGLFGLLQFRAGHRAGLVQHDGEIERRAPELLPVGDGGEVNFDDDLLRRILQQDIALRHEFQVQGFSGEQVDGQTRRQTEGEQCFFHAATLPDGAGSCQGRVKGL